MELNDIVFIIKKKSSIFKKSIRQLFSSSILKLKLPPKTKDTIQDTSILQTSITFNACYTLKVVNDSCSIKMSSGHVESDFVRLNFRLWQDISILSP